MRTWFWSLLTMLTLLAGCAQGYYDRPPAYRELGPTMTWYQNPETEEEYEMRLWSEDAGGH